MSGTSASFENQHGKYSTTNNNNNNKNGRLDENCSKSFVNFTGKHQR